MITRLWPAAIFLCLAQIAFGGDLLRLDHYVQVRSEVPSIRGHSAQVYVREVVQPGIVMRGGPAADRVALFIHGSGTPAEVAFDVPYEDYSWMAYLARAGFDVFSMDMTGYGRSTRPWPMNDPCNLSKEQQAEFIPSLIAAPCAASYPNRTTSVESDWHDIETVVDHILALRGVQKVSLLGWSLGGPRAVGYANQNKDKVSRIVLLAPAYRRGAPPTATQPAASPAMNVQTRADFINGWDRQVGCTDQYETAARDSIWSEMLASDAVGATWGGGVRRAPQVDMTRWDPSVVGSMQIPMLLVTGAHDKQVNPDRVHEFYEDLAAPQKVLIDLGCSSHNAMWERNHLLMFRASLEWLTDGTVDGKSEGVVRLGY